MNLRALVPAEKSHLASALCAAAALGLNRDGKYSRGPMLVGFSILQQDNMMPLQTVFSIGNSYSQELLQCF
jgi:hypothetical protein